MATALLDGGQTHFVTGNIQTDTISTDTGSQTGMTTSDGAITVSGTNAAITVNFGAAFHAAPYINCTPIGTAAATTTPAVVIVSKSATDCVLATWNYGDQTNAPAAGDFDFDFLIVGKRNR